MSEELVRAAIAAADFAYAPYSNFHVGAAALLRSGEVITAANFENASYGMTLCAETVAIAKASSEGKLGEIVAIAIAGGPAGKVAASADPVTPCGRCRQIIREAADLSGTDIAIHCAHDGGHDSFTITQLLPHGFGPASLK
jgi:cytidine deaminase